MTVNIELMPELARRLELESARSGQPPAEFVREAIEEKLGASSVEAMTESRRERNQRALALLRQWRTEDAKNPDSSPVPVIPPLSLREIRID